MDSNVLVETKIEDGKRLIRHLIREQFEVQTAFWVKRSEEGSWQLWLASPAVDPQRLGDALSTVFAALTKVPGCTVSATEITLLSDSDPIAREAAILRDRYPSQEVFQGKRLGKLATEKLLMYPRPLPWDVRELPDGAWQVRISERDDVWLTCETEGEARAIAEAPVLKDQALAHLKTGPEFAAKLEMTADALQKYRMDFGSRFLRRRAQEVR